MGTSLNLTGTILLNGNLSVQSTSNFGLNGVISGAGGLFQAATGTLSLRGLNTYTGGTTISMGTLALAATGQLGSGATFVASGAFLSFANLTASTYAFASGDVLSGAGTVTLSSKTVTVSGKLSPGAASTGNLKMTVSGSGGTLQFDATTKFEYTLKDPAVSSSNTYLGFTGTNTLALGESVVNFDDFSFLTGTGFTGTGTYTLISGASSHTGSLGSSLSGMIGSSSVGTLSLSGHNLMLTVSAASAIPEPSTYAALCGGLVLTGAMVLRRRKRAA